MCKLAEYTSFVDLPELLPARTSTDCAEQAPQDPASAPFTPLPPTQPHPDPHMQPVTSPSRAPTEPTSDNARSVPPQAHVPAISQPPLAHALSSPVITSPAVVHWTEAIHPADPRCKSRDFTEAKRAEISNLISRGAFTVVVESDLAHSPNVLPARFVLTIKHSNGRTAHRAPFVIGGHRDRQKRLLVQTTSTPVCQTFSSTRGKFRIGYILSRR